MVNLPPFRPLHLSYIIHTYFIKKRYVHQPFFKIENHPPPPGTLPSYIYTKTKLICKLTYIFHTKSLN